MAKRFCINPSSAVLAIFCQYMLIELCCICPELNDALTTPEPHYLIFCRAENSYKTSNEVSPTTRLTCSNNFAGTSSRQLLCSPEFSSLLRWLLRLCAKGCHFSNGSLHIFQNQCREHWPSKLSLTCSATSIQLHEYKICAHAVDWPRDNVMRIGHQLNTSDWQSFQRNHFLTASA